MTVEGGMETLLNKFDDHFDDTKTALLLIIPQKKNLQFH
jgi:hypothetical protein